MLINTQVASTIQQSKRSDMDPANSAASALYSGVMQSVQNAATATQVQATQQAKDTTADNVAAALAKTRVQLQTTPSSTSLAKTETSGQARTEFHDYMNKTPAERIREQILAEQGLTEDDVKAMPIEQQNAITNEVTERLKIQASEQLAAKNAEPQAQSLKDTLAAV